MSTEQNNLKETQEGKGKKIEGELTIPFPEDFVYANASALGTSLMDVHISFAEVLPTGAIRTKVGVVMPADHAALLALNLFEQIALFEHNFGPIRHPAWKAFRDKAAVVREEAGKMHPEDSAGGQTEKP
jgi:hypothetical protein